MGIRRWNEKFAGRNAPERSPGATINRRDLFAIPHPNARHLWRDLHVRDIRQVEGCGRTKNEMINVAVEGINEDKLWKCGLEFDYANEETFYYRPMRLDEGQHPDSPTPNQAGTVRIPFLPSMSGLAANETRVDQGAVNARVGEGRTAEILRNLCFSVFDRNPDRWKSLATQVENLFGSTLGELRYVEERGEIATEYREHDISFDLSASGRGLQ